ncbi:MAG: hypothetical protein ACJ76D_09585 [Solirubrobacterales bacterium]
MPKRNRTIAVLLGAVLALLVALPVSASAAPSPWWQVLTGSRPTNLWVPSDSLQEVTTEVGVFEGVEGVLAVFKIEGNVAGCLGAGEAGTFCPFFDGGDPPLETAAQLEAALEAAYGTSTVEVSGGPVGVAPFKVTVPRNHAAPIDFSSEGAVVVGKAADKVISPGGSGRLVVTITNLGDAPVDATSTPVNVIDELPQGVEATTVQGFAGVKDKSGPVDCTVKTPGEVACTFGGTLPSYESLEVEVFATLTGSPPVAGSPGSVAVSGGNAATAAVAQPIKVDPEPTPFGIERLSAQAEEEGGAPATRAGAHPFQITTTVQFNSGPMIDRSIGIQQPAQPRNVRFTLPAGFVGNTTAVSQCPLDVFLSANEELVNECPDEAAIGVSSVTLTGLLGFMRVAIPVFNLPPAVGEPARLGFTVAGDPVVIDTAVDPDNKYRVVASVNNASQLVQLLSSTVTLWGTPGDSRHDTSRGWACAYRLVNLGSCQRPGNLQEDAFLRMPVSCKSPLSYEGQVEPWNTPNGSVVDERTFLGGTPSACNQVPFNPTVAAEPTDKRANASSGLDFELQMPNVGLLSKDAISEGQAKKVEVTLPEGVTVNPSQAEGLGACSPADYARETAGSAAGQGCPETSKVGSVEISTPLLEEPAKGSLYVAKPFDNPFGSLLALYMVAKIPERGILIKQAGKVELNPQTGQVVTSFDDLPQLPFADFKLHFFEGDRAPLVMPSSCGTYPVVARFTPWNAADPDNPLPNEIVTRTSSFTVNQGSNGGSCPSGRPPFNPHLSAGTTDNAAGKYSPFNIRLTREDGEQEFSRFSVKLPPGAIGKLAGVPFCPDTAITAARARSGQNGGQEELEHPSCPGASQIGTTLVGAGVGSSLTWVPGKLYLAGPYQGSKLSVVAIATAKVGPFDLGTVVIRQALRIDPETAEVTSDGSSSDPIPHILQGIVVRARDIRVSVDRRDFMLNPTSCERMTTAAQVFGAGLDYNSAADDQLADASAPFQAADCRALGFKPKLSLSLKGGTRRADTPRLRAVLTARKGDANIGRAQVTLPHSMFLEQAHIRTVCTRVQFNAGTGDGQRCPKGAIYGRARAISPLLDEPLVGPVYLRSSNNPLPDLVAALHSRKVDINLVGRIDSHNGGLRTTFQRAPDAPVSKFVLNMQGGRKGLVTNSVNLCGHRNRATAAFTAQNGKVRTVKPLVKASCGRK